MNGFFTVWENSTTDIDGFQIPSSWWSRVYEYPWALQFATGTAADMGAGWMDRPFKDMLSRHCDTVYAFDLDARLLELKAPDNVKLIVKDFTKNMRHYYKKFDRVFCISVLEDVPNVEKALMEFERCLAASGKIVLTMDVQYDISKPLGKYKGVDMEKFIFAINNAGLQFVGDTDFTKMNIIYNNEFNLCCFRCVLERINE